MEIKKLENFSINENDTYSTEEQKAIDAGYELGDLVYNIKMDKNLTIVKNPKIVMNDDDDATCTLGSVGQFLNNYTKVEIDPIENKSSFRKIDVEKRIKRLLHFVVIKGIMTKRDLKRMINVYIDDM